MSVLLILTVISYNPNSMNHYTSGYTGCWMWKFLQNASSKS